MQSIRIRLPSGLDARVGVGDGDDPIADDVVDGRRSFCGRMLNALDRGAVVIEARSEDGWRSLERDAIGGLTLADFHAARDIAERLGAVVPEPFDERWECRNCGVELDVDRISVPVRDLEDWYAGAEAPPRGPFPLGTRVKLAGGRRADTIEVAPVTVKEARPLWHALGKPGDLRITSAVVEALGVRALGAVSDGRVIARALSLAPDSVWGVVETLFVTVNYSTRSHFPLVCPACEAVHDVPRPVGRELWSDPDAERLLRRGSDAEDRPVTSHGPFPSEGDFASLVEEIGREVYRARGVRAVELVTDVTVPPVDDAGEPLLGSYQPLVDTDTAGYSDVRFRISLYYRTFEGMHRDEPYDVAEEIRETIDHEVEHHLHHLSGRDPLDEQERSEAREDLARTFGERAVRRAHMRELAAELRRLGWAVGLPVVLLGLLALLLGALGVFGD